MDISTILSKTDHTLLAPGCTWEQIQAIIDDGIHYRCASVCIPARYVKQAAQYAKGAVKICTVIGFPTGYSTTAAKVFETEDALKNGADEIDMVIAVGAVKEHNYAAVLEDIRAVRAACKGKVLKVIVETCLLNEEEKIKMCEIVGESGADYIKTSTGFASGGATHEDIVLFQQHVKNGLKIKAAGGIVSLEDAARFIEEGADRLGTSRIVKLVKEMHT
ncbi:MAG: deoxyribose-phosphate aldolase [Ruminococcaceae bacterium]|nr:deoxyribose-phosphate aldolase [Oscillospiraceae bacterium]